jgi:hypothetical protein
MFHFLEPVVIQGNLTPRACISDMGRLAVLISKLVRSSWLIGMIAQDLGELWHPLASTKLAGTLGDHNILVKDRVVIG